MSEEKKKDDVYVFKLPFGVIRFIESKNMAFHFLVASKGSPLRNTQHWPVKKENKNTVRSNFFMRSEPCLYCVPILAYEHPTHLLNK